MNHTFGNLLQHFCLSVVLEVKQLSQWLNVLYVLLEKLIKDGTQLSFESEFADSL